MVKYLAKPLMACLLCGNKYVINILKLTSDQHHPHLYNTMHQSSRGEDILLSSKGAINGRYSILVILRRALQRSYQMDDDVHINASQTQEDKVKWLRKY